MNDRKGVYLILLLGSLCTLNDANEPLNLWLIHVGGQEARPGWTVKLDCIYISINDLSRSIVIFARWWT
jgi:hypothetical protein